MQTDEAKYGVLAEGTWDGWQDGDQAIEITEPEFEALWTASRKVLDSRSQHQPR